MAFLTVFAIKNEKRQGDLNLLYRRKKELGIHLFVNCLVQILIFCLSSKGRILYKAISFAIYQNLNCELCQGPISKSAACLFSIDIINFYMAFV
jgi:hypothetical protein